jgi:HD-GYP domain-containing protein (c-di-GMP phosphodiesterase class II)
VATTAYPTQDITSETPRLAEITAALTLATDLAMGQPLENALRVTLLSVRFGAALGLNQRDCRDLYYVAMLRGSGCTANAHMLAQRFGDDIAQMARFAKTQPLDLRHALRVVNNDPELSEVAAAFCEVAQMFADRLELGPQVRVTLGCLLEQWDGNGAPKGLRGEDIPLLSRIIRMTEDVIIAYRDGGIDAAINVTRNRSTIVYDPTLVARFCDLAPELLPPLTDEPSWDVVLGAEPGGQPRLSTTQLDTACRALADFADLKSPYFHGHSAAVADLAARAGEECGLPVDDISALRRAGYVHDLGRVGVSNAIWEKSGSLTIGDWERVRLHPYFTERILARPDALKTIANVAALHHERLDGNGYHRSLPAAMQPLPVRILAAADVYQAMVEARPHRPALSPNDAAAALRDEVEAGRLDRDAANAVLAAAGHRVRSTRPHWPAGLSNREVEVLRLLSRGLSSREIADHLSISDKTVGHHIEHIYGKANVSTRAAATLFALQNGLIAEPLISVA